MQFDSLNHRPTALGAVGIVNQTVVPLRRRRSQAGAIVIVPAVVHLNSFSTALVVLLVVELNIRAGLSYGPEYLAEVVTTVTTLSINRVL